MLNDLILYSREVAEAINFKKPIVALESTIISHGMPYPDNIETAKEVEAIIRDHGATPATIALYGGKIHIGLEETIMKSLSESNIIKASRRDLAYVLSQGLTASTTVAATMYCACLAGISIFVTGGIGGVHQHVDENYDISADLTELSNTAITVICSGAKSILDLPKTLEALETLGVSVIGYQTDEFPAFYSRSSGIPLECRLDNPEDISKLMHTSHQLKLEQGLLIANPIPKAAEIPKEQITPLIQQACLEAKNISGKALTPFLLKRLTELSKGKTLKANIELIKNNALLGAKVALAYQNQKISKNY